MGLLFAKLWSLFSVEGACHSSISDYDYEQELPSPQKRQIFRIGTVRYAEGL